MPKLHPLSHTHSGPVSFQSWGSCAASSLPHIGPGLSRSHQARHPRVQWPPAIPTGQQEPCGHRGHSTGRNWGGHSSRTNCWSRQLGRVRQTQAPLSTQMEFTWFTKPRTWKVSQAPRLQLLSREVLTLRESDLDRWQVGRGRGGARGEEGARAGLQASLCSVLGADTWVPEPWAEP